MISPFISDEQKYTRHIPLVFVDGAPEKGGGHPPAKLPDAGIYQFRRAQTTLFPHQVGLREPHCGTCDSAQPDGEVWIAHGRAKTRYQRKRHRHPDRPATRLCRCARRTSGGSGALLEDPDPVQAVTLWFVRDPRVYQAEVHRMREIANRTKLWVVWRKGSAGKDKRSGLTR